MPLTTAIRRFKHLPSGRSSQRIPSRSHDRPLWRSPPFPQNLDNSAVIQLLRAVKAGAGFDQSLWAHQQYWDLFTAILASRSNNAYCTDGEVYIDCKSQTGQVLRRVPVIQLTTSDRVFHGCLLCHRQSWSPRIEIRNRLRYPNTPCGSCQALDLQRPDLAKLIAPDPTTGIKKDASQNHQRKQPVLPFPLSGSRLFKRRPQEGEVTGAQR